MFYFFIRIFATNCLYISNRGIQISTMTSFIRNTRYSFSTKAGLQVRMTFWVVSTVAVVASIVMIITTSVLGNEFESELKKQIKSDIEASTKIINQRMTRVEYIAKTATSILETDIDNGRLQSIDSILPKILRDIECIDVVSLSLDDETDTLQTTYTAYARRNDTGRTIYALPPVKEILYDDLSWKHSFQENQEFWCAPFIPKDFPQDTLYCFSVPVRSAEGATRGMLCVMVFEQWIKKLITQYKTRDDIDIAVYNRKGTLVIPPDGYIRLLPPTELIVEECYVERLGWHMVISANRHVISDRSKHIIWQMALAIVTLLLFMALAIIMTVRHVARPFVQEQQRTAEAKAAMQRELQIAAETQRQLVPHKLSPFPNHPEIDIHACLHPAREVGGDLYDYFIEKDNIYFCIGDVSGKGVPASLFMAATHYLFRSVASAMPISEAMQQMNCSLCTDNAQCMFVTFFFARLDLLTGMLEYCNAGHNPPILIHEGNACFFAESESIPLGVWEEAEYPSHSIQFDGGDTILLYTDGVTEAKNADDKELGEKKTLQYVSESVKMSPEQIINNILKHVNAHAGTTPQSDDITMLCIAKK